MAKTMRNRAVNSKTLFITTSPRTPFKMIPEIALLDEEMNGEEWTPETQAKFYHLLRDRDFFEGEESKTPALSARDRINRSPKALGFVSLPIVGLTPVGKEFVESNNKEEILLRQMLKFQLPSPYHPMGNGAADFCVKPYLELFRLVRTLGTLSFDELQIFGMQLVNYNYFDDIVEKIKQFREDKERYKGKYKEFKQKVFYREARKIYEDEILSGNIRTRESRTTTVESFLDKKISNLRDYADAGVRYLRSTGLVFVTAIGKSLSIIPEKIKDVDYILDTIDRKPCYINELVKYENYLWNPTTPRLLTDDKDKIIDKLSTEFGITTNHTLSINRLKDILNENIQNRKEKKIAEQVKVLKDYTLYNEIDETFDTMGKAYEPSLFFEWNTWRAMTMLDGGDIKANLKFDDSGNPMNTALGKMADIECDYGDFDVTVEVSLSSGALQFKMEGEPVPRHIGIHKEKAKKPTYCFFIAPTINPATIAHFYTLYISNVDMYGGKCTIIPLQLDTFRKMLKDAVDAPVRPTPNNIKRLFEQSQKYAKDCFVNDENETVWYNRITKDAMNWLNI